MLLRAAQLWGSFETHEFASYHAHWEPGLGWAVMALLERSIDKVFTIWVQIFVS